MTNQKVPPTLKKAQLDKGRYVVLDTSILIAAADPQRSRKTQGIIRHLREQKFNLVVSSVSIFELSKPRAIPSHSLIWKFPVLALSKDVLLNAAYVHQTHKHRNAPGQQSDCDLLIAGSVTYLRLDDKKSAYLLTLDDDFCGPCWELIAQERISYFSTSNKKADKWKIDTVRLVEFDFSKSPKEIMTDSMKEIHLGKQDDLNL